MSRNDLDCELQPAYQTQPEPRKRKTETEGSAHTLAGARTPAYQG